MAKRTKTESIIDVIETVEKREFSNESYILKLEKDNTSLSDALQKVTEKLAEANEKILHLEKMLSSGVGLVAISDEELIADIQLKKLSEKAKFGELTLEEIKKFDLLVKNKRLAQGNPTAIEGKKVPELPTHKLLEIAASKKTEER